MTHAQPKPAREEPKSRLLVEVVSPRFVHGRPGQKLILSDMTASQVQCLIESGAVRPVERPDRVEPKKEAK